MKSYAILLALLITNVSYGQENFTVSNTELLDIKGYNVQFSPDGKQLLYSDKSFKGLKLYDIANKSVKEISNEAGAGYKPVMIGNDEVLFKTKEKNTQIQVFNTLTEMQTAIDKSSNYKSAKSYALIQQMSKPSTLSATAADNLNAIELNISGNKTTIAPLGDKVDYINISLSPNQSKLLFRVSGLGSYVSDLEGNIIKELGNVEFPKWINDETVLYTITKDDGYQYLSSNLYVSSIILPSKPKLISTPKHIVLYPDYNPSQNRIVFNTPKGEVVLIGLK